MARLVRVEWGVLVGARPRALGKNARLREHGQAVRLPLCRITDSDGAQGVGFSRLDPERAFELIGSPLPDVVAEEPATEPRWRPLDYPLWDLAGVRAGEPVYRLGPLAVPDDPTVACYDTSLYFDDLFAEHRDHAAAAAILAAEAAAGYELGHRAFKVKVGRGARWMSPVAGLARDVAVVRAVREAVGDGCPLLVDANNGFTLNGTKELLQRIAPSQPGWIEEPFAEDAELLGALRAWRDEVGLGVEVADGETATPEQIEPMAAAGLLDVVQCDILGCGFSGWRRLGPRLDSLGVGSAPHHFGLHLGNYVTGHLVGFVRGLRAVEWDETATPGIVASGYRIEEGRLHLGDEPGFGIGLEEKVFAEAVRANGFDLELHHTGH